MAGSAMTGFTTARSARTARSNSSTSRRRRASDERSGGPALATPTTSICAPVRRARWPQSRGLEQLGFWRAIAEHPATTTFWQHQAVDKLLAKEPLTVPMMIVSGLFDQEDIYGGPALYKALAAEGSAAERSCIWCSGPGITGRAGAKAAASARSSSKATRPAGFAAT